MAKVEPISVPALLTLKAETYQKLAAESKSDPATTIRTWAEWFLEQYATGGLMLQPRHMEALQKANGDAPFTEAAQIVRLVEKALGFHDGAFVIRFEIDPSLHVPLEGHAKEMGLTVKEVLTEVANCVLQNGWAFELYPEGGNIPMDATDRREFVRLLGKQTFNSKDVLAMLRKRSATEAVAV